MLEGDETKKNILGGLRSSWRMMLERGGGVFEPLSVLRLPARVQTYLEDWAPVLRTAGQPESGTFVAHLARQLYPPWDDLCSRYGDYGRAILVKVFCCIVYPDDWGPPQNPLRMLQPLPSLGKPQEEHLTPMLLTGSRGWRIVDGLLTNLVEVGVTAR